MEKPVFCRLLSQRAALRSGWQVYTDLGWRALIPVRRRKTLAKAISISLTKFTTSVQAAVKGAVAKHPKFKVEAPQRVSISYLIRGFPVPEAIASQVTLGETQAYADEIAASLSAAHAELLAPKAGGTAEGAVISIGRHIIVGIPPVSQVFELEK